MPGSTEGDIPPLSADDLLDKRVYDVNGHLLGRVSLCRERGDGVSSFDVALVRSARRGFGTDRDVATLDPSLVIDAESEVSLCEEGRYLLHPEFAPLPLDDAGR